MRGVPKMDNADGRMLETGLMQGKSALSCRNRDGNGAGAEAALLRRPTAVGNTTAQRPKTREQGGRR